MDSEIKSPKGKRFVAIQIIGTALAFFSPLIFFIGAAFNKTASLDILKYAFAIGVVLMLMGRYFNGKPVLGIKSKKFSN